MAPKKTAVDHADALFDTPKAAQPEETPPSGYRALLAQRDELEAKIKEVRELEVAHVLEQIRQLVEDYDLHDQVQFVTRPRPGPGAPRGPRGPIPAKYRDPATGQTWSGRGKPPRWIAGKDRNQFLID